MFRYLSAILFLALCAPCWGQSYVQSDLIDGPKAVAVGELFKVKIQGDLPYKLDPEPVSIDEVLDRKGNLLLLVVAGEPGELKISVDYRVVHPTDEEIEKAPWEDREKFKAWLKSQAGRDDEFYSDLHTVKVGDKKDDKKDEDDKDDSDPKPGPYWIVFLEESGERTPDTAKILADVAFLKSLTDAGHKWRVYDDDHADAKSFAALTTHRPALIVTTLSGEVVHTVQLPKTAKEITDLLKGGK